MLSPKLSRYLPILEWGRHYDRDTLSADLMAAVIVTIMLIPQSLAYALLAGLPPEMGLFASIVPIMLYAVFGTSKALAVGPVAVVSLMTAAALGQVAASGTADYISAALTLAALSGGILLAMGLFRLGFLANFLSHPVIAGFITASGILIAASQIGNILGIRVKGDTIVEQIETLWVGLDGINWITFAIGAASTAFLFWVRKGLKPLLRKWGLAPRPADMLAKAGPVLAVVVTTLIVKLFNLTEMGVAVVGTVPQGFPPSRFPALTLTSCGRCFCPPS